MARKPNTDRNGSSFDTATVEAVWRKGEAVLGVDSSRKRKDVCGAWIERYKYGVTAENGTGWEIDHIKPVSKGGSDLLDNLQPLQWQNNRQKGDNCPNWSCATKAHEG